MPQRTPVLAMFASGTRGKNAAIFFMDFDLGNEGFGKDPDLVASFSRRPSCGLNNRQSRLITTGFDTENNHNTYTLHQLIHFAHIGVQLRQSFIKIIYE